MSVITAVDDGTLAEVFDALRSEVDAERDRTVAEIDAFAGFAERVSDLRPSQPSPGRPGGGGVTGGALSLDPQSRSSPGPADDAAAVRAAYEETVMSLPFYDDAYGESYEANVLEEFGPDVGTVLIQSGTFTPTVQSLLLSKVSEAISARETLRDTCDRERESIDWAEGELTRIRDEVEAIQIGDPEEWDFDALVVYHDTLGELAKECEQVAARRQADIDSCRHDFSLHEEEPDVGAFLYEEFPVTYPVLYLCSDLARRIESVRVDVERAVSGRP